MYEGTDLLGEYGTGGAQSTGSTEYIYLPTDQGNVLVGAIINGQAYAVHTDHLNTPRLMTDAANQPVWQWGYSAFGDNEPSIAARNFRDRSWAFAKGVADGSDDVENNPQFSKKMVKMNLRYPGQYFDDESNLRYNGFRSYGPPGGRYTQVDPIGLVGGWNPVVYVDNNPLIFVDPAALQSIGRNKAIDNTPLTGGGGGGSPVPNFVVSPGGTAFPVPAGARGPVPVVNPSGSTTGSAFTGGSGGANGQVTTMRIMDPTPARGNSPGYSTGYVKYENCSRQGVDPYSGKTLPNSESHFPK